jgi:hypothetical protein
MSILTTHVAERKINIECFANRMLCHTIKRLAELVLRDGAMEPAFQLSIR